MIVSGCTSIPLVHTDDHLDKNDFTFGQHSVIIDKRYEYMNELCMSDEKSKMTYYSFSRWRGSGVKILYKEMKTVNVYWKNIDWTQFYENVLYYQKPEFALEGDIYTWRMIRSKFYDGQIVISTFHFVGNQKWLIIEYFYETDEKFDLANVNNIMRMADSMIHIRHNKIPKQITVIERGMERLNSIFFK